MNKKHLAAAALLSLGCSAHAGGLLTNTNTNIAFNRNFARDGVIAIDGVYSNPAGVAFLPKGLHLSLNVQNAYQTRTIQSGISVPGLENTPFHNPFKLNGGDAAGVKEFVGKAVAPVIPSVQAALNYDKWGFQAAFAVNGGGGKAVFNSGLGSFERSVAMLPLLLNQKGLSSATPAYKLDSYISGQQYVFGVQLGATYKINEHMAVYGGMRVNYLTNKYDGSITNLTANIAGQDQNLYEYFSTQGAALREKAATYGAQAAAVQDPAVKAQLAGAAAQYDAAAKQMEDTKPLVADRYLECTQTGWGVTPIVGFDYKAGKWNFGTRLELNTHVNLQNDTKRDDTGMFQNGVNTPSDLPGLWTVGAQYEALPNLRVMAGYHYFFDKSAKMADDKQKLLDGNTQEILAGAEWDITDAITVSAGGQRTMYGLGDGSYLSDMSFVTSSYSVGFGAKVKVMRNASLNIAYFWTSYEDFDKAYTSEIRSVKVANTDRFTRTNKVLGVGLDIDF